MQNMFALQNHDKRLNALYFSLLELLNIKITKKDNEDDHEQDTKQSVLR